MAPMAINSPERTEASSERTGKFEPSELIVHTANVARINVPIGDRICLIRCCHATALNSLASNATTPMPTTTANTARPKTKLGIAAPMRAANNMAKDEGGSLNNSEFSFTEVSDYYCQIDNTSFIYCC